MMNAAAAWNAMTVNATVKLAGMKRTAIVLSKEPLPTNPNLGTVTLGVMRGSVMEELPLAFCQTHFLRMSRGRSVREAKIEMVAAA